MRPLSCVKATSLAERSLEAAHGLVDVVTRAKRGRAHKALTARAESGARGSHDVTALQDVCEHVPVAKRGEPRAMGTRLRHA